MSQDDALEMGLPADELAALVGEQHLFNERMLERALAMPAPGTVDIDVLRRRRRLRLDKCERDRSVSDELLETPYGFVPLRRFRHSIERGCIVHFHGGGWVFGGIDEQDRLLGELASAASATVITIGYPLAPETLLPETMCIARAALEALVDGSDGPVAVAGESAGAHLAVQSVIGLPPDMRGKIKALSLVYGIYDLSMTPSQRAWGKRLLGLSTDWLSWFYDQALPGQTAEQRRHPMISPLYADLGGLPPALFTVGDLDPLLDDTTFMYQRWLAARNVASLLVFPEAPHGFNHADTGLARHCNATIAAFLGNRLHACEERHSS